MPSVMAPENTVLRDEDKCRESPRVSLLAPDQVPLHGCSDTTGDSSRTEHLSHASPLDAKGGVDLLVRVRDTSGTGPEGVEESGSFFGRSHVHEENLGKRWVATGGPTEILDDLLGKQSSKVTQEDEQSGLPGRDGIAEP